MIESESTESGAFWTRASRKVVTLACPWTGTAASAVRWDELTRAQSPLADARWARSFVDAFAEPATAPTLYEVYRGPRLVAALPMVRDEGLVRAWTSLDNEHTPYAPIAGALDADTAGNVLETLLRDAELVCLRRLPCESPACVALDDAAQRMGLHVSLLETAGSGDARLVLRDSWDTFRATLPKHIRVDMPRKQRQLERLGLLEYEAIKAPGAALSSALAECYDVETRGWKGTDGAPIKSDPRTLRFYTGLAERLAAVGRFVLYVLRLDREIIAFEYCLRGGGHLEMLKLSFDPAHARYSPGQVLRLLLFEEELAQGDVI